MMNLQEIYQSSLRHNRSITTEKEIGLNSMSKPYLITSICFARQKIQLESGALVNTFCRRQCAKYMIPQGRSNSKALGLNSEVMVQMVFLRYSRKFR
jgi:hypothetical protein